MASCCSCVGVVAREPNITTTLFSTRGEYSQRTTQGRPQLRKFRAHPSARSSVGVASLRRAAESTVAAPRSPPSPRARLVGRGGRLSYFLWDGLEAADGASFRFGAAPGHDLAA